MIKIYDIYVRTTGFLLQPIDFFRCKKHSQHSMLANPDFKNILIHYLKQEILQTFMLAFCLYITSSFTIIYLEVIANIYIISGG